MQHQITQYFERQYNLLYLPIFNQEEEQDTKGFFKKMSSSNKKALNSLKNIRIYDIPKKMSFDFFAADELRDGETIIGFFYENYYQPSTQKIELGIYGPINIVNNFNIEERYLSEQLFVLTFNTNKQLSLWAGDKWGLEKSIICEFSEGSQMSYDVYNSSVRIMNNFEDINDFNIL